MALEYRHWANHVINPLNGDGTFDVKLELIKKLDENMNSFNRIKPFVDRKYREESDKDYDILFYNIISIQFFILYN